MANEWYKFVKENFPEQHERMKKYGRRNVSFSTVAPTGTVSLMTQTTSGLEPLFLPYYMRRKKINPNDKESRVDFVDAKGDKWQEFAVLHPKFKDWLKIQYLLEFPVFDNEKAPSFDEYFTKEKLDQYFVLSPWYGSCANDISWEARVDIQAIIQKYTTNAISSTINLPNDVSKEEVANIYWRAWKAGLKGVTVYRDGCRTGVLVNTDANTKEVAFSQNEAAKRPKTLDCQINRIKVKGEDFTVIVGILENKPYEIFAFDGKIEDKPNSGKITKAGKGKYVLSYDSDDETHELDFNGVMSDEQGAITRLISTSLRHGTEVKYIVEQLNKTHGNMVSFTKAITRVLKPFIPEGTKSSVNCNECGSSNVVFSEGCNKCLDCGNSKCG